MLSVSYNSVKSSLFGKKQRVLHSEVRPLLTARGLALRNIGVSTSCVLTEDARSRVFFSVTTTRGRIQSQYLQLHRTKGTNASEPFAAQTVLWPGSFSLKGSVLEVFDNGCWSEPGVEDVVHCILDLFTDHQVITFIQSCIWRTRLDFLTFTATSKCPFQNYSAYPLISKIKIKKIMVFITVLLYFLLLGFHQICLMRQCYQVWRPVWISLPSISSSQMYRGR